MSNLIRASLEQIIFPAPNPSNYTYQSHKDNLLWIPTLQGVSNTVDRIPCMLYSPTRTATLFIIWCHGNGVDIGTMDTTMKAFSRRLQVHVLIFEYPKYGLLKGTRPTPNKETINRFAECAFSFVRDTLKWPTDRIIIYGHSIGTGPACHLASTLSVGGLILQSPYTSIENLVREKIPLIFGWLSIPYWNNIETRGKIRCPVLFIHGQSDSLIPYHHSQTLHDALRPNHQKRKLVFLPTDDHNSISDPVLLIHVRAFLHDCFAFSEESMPDITLDPSLRTAPINDMNAGEVSKAPWYPFKGVFQPLLQSSLSAIQNLCNSKNSTVSENEPAHEESTNSFTDVD